MKVLLTGGTGKVGVAAVRRLRASGHDVTVIGRREAMDVPDGAAYVQCDINDFDGVSKVMEGHDSIVHLAAIPTPHAVPGRDVFRVNDLGTFIVYEAAAKHGISRIVGASSINAFGFFYGLRGFPIQYLPVNEAHPGVATDAYSFSKQVMESIGQYFWDRDGISSVMLRLPAVLSPEWFDRYAEGHEGVRAIATRLIDMPDEERKREVARLSAAYDAFRTAHRWDEFAPTTGWKAILEMEIDGLNRDEYRFMASRANLFTYVHEDDSANAIELGLTADYEGSHPLYINVHRNTLGRPVKEVALLFDDPMPEVRPSRNGDDTVLSIDRARELLGFEPEFVA